MERHYYSRGRLRTLEQIEGVLAVRMSTDATGQRLVGLEDFGFPATRRTEETEPILTLSEDEAAAYQKAGWEFIRPTELTVRALEEGTLPEGILNISPVYHRADGRVVIIETDRLTVKLNPELSEGEVRATLQASGLEPIRCLKFAPNLYEVQIRGHRDALDLSVELQEHESFVYAEPVMIECIPGRFTPTDPDYTQQWQWNNTGAGGGTVGADIRAEAAWNHTRGAGARIAVIDNGFDADHEDLAAAVVADSGYFDSSKNFQRTLAGYPGSSHGTFCAGMAAARHNNGRGGCGAAPESGLLLVACLGDQVGDQVTLARSVAYAADPTQEIATASPEDGADVISCSLGPNGADWEMQSVLEDAINFAVTDGRGGLGTPIFWATSNGFNVPISSDEVVSHPGVIAVGRSTRNDTEDNSARGPKLEFLATGVGVYSTYPNNTYGTGSGTSYAAPCAAGVAGLILSIRPDLSWEQVRQIIRDTCDKIGGAVYDANGHNDDYGFGRINAFRAILAALSGSLILLDVL